MSAIAPATTVSAALPRTGVAMPTAPHGAGSLVPRPNVPVGSIESLYALMTETGAQQAKNGKIEVERKFVEKREQLKKFEAEVKKAAEEKSSGIFKTLATVGMVVVAAAATVCSAGVAGPVVVAVGLGLSASGFLVGETKCLDGLLGEGVSAWVGMGLGLCGAVVTGFGGGAPAALKVAQGAVTVANGCQKVDDAVHAYNADEHLGHAKEAEQTMRRLQRAVEDIIAQLQDSKDTSRHGSEAVNTIAETQGQTLVIASGGRA